MEIKGEETGTKTLRQTIYKKIKPKEEYTISNWLKWEKVKGDNLVLEISFYRTEQFLEKLSLKYREHIDTYQFLSKTVYAKNESDKIILEIKYQGKGKIRIGELRFSKALSSTDYLEYNGKNHLKKKITNQNEIEYTYDYDLQTDGKENIRKITDKDQTIEMNYDSENRVIEQNINHSQNQMLEYDVETKKIKSVQTLVGNIKRKRTYVDSSYYRETEEDGYYQTLIKDLYGEVYQYINPKEMIKTMPKGANGKANKVSYSHSEKRKEYAIQYDEKQRIKKLIGDGNTYSYFYNDQNDIIEIKLGLAPLLKNQYATTIKNIGGTEHIIYDSKLVKQIYSNNMLTYDYIYNDQDQIETIKINNVVKYEYEYNENFLISKKKFLKSATQIEETLYTYDENNQLIKEETENLKIYLNPDKKQKSYQIINTMVNQETQIQMEQDYRSIIEIESLKGSDYLENYEEGLMAFGNQCLEKQYGMKKDVQIKSFFPNIQKKSDRLFINLDQINQNRENYGSWQQKFKETSSIYLWIKPEGRFVERYLFGLFDNDSLNRIHDLKCTSEGKIIFNEIELESQIKLNEWNLLGVQLDHKQFKYKLILNEEIKESSFLQAPFNYDLLTIGMSFFDDYSEMSKSEMNFLIGNLIISNEYKGQSEIEQMYREKKRFEKSLRGLEKIESVYKAESDCEILTFRTSLVSNKGRKPNKYDIKGDEEKIYCDDGIKIYDSTHNLENNTLLSAYYDFDIPKTGGEIGFEFIADKRIESRVLTTLFSLGDISFQMNGKSLYLTYLENLEIKQVYVGEVNLGSSTKIGISFKNNKLEVYYGYNRVLNMNWETIYFEQKEIIIGNKHERNFDGVIKNLIYGETLGLLNYIQNVKNIEISTCQKVLDSQDRTLKKIVDDKEERYLYEKNGAYDLNRINKVKQINGVVVSYEYDENRNIKKIITNRESDLNYQYVYDEFDQLIEEKWSDGRRIYYNYDLEGNITYKCLEKDHVPLKGYLYSYQGGVLKSINLQHLMEERIYQYSLLGEVVRIQGNRLYWQEKRLTKYNNNFYEYNEEGIRDKKIVNGEITNTYLEKMKVIAEEKNGKMIYYLYDESDILYGYEYGGNKYYYVRNLIGNIDEIIDSSGNSVVKYTYSGYGEIIDEILINSYKEDAVKANSFLYKGYYYDRETDLPRVSTEKTNMNQRIRLQTNNNLKIKYVYYHKP